MLVVPTARLPDELILALSAPFEVNASTSVAGENIPVLLPAPAKAYIGALVLPATALNVAATPIEPFPIVSWLVPPATISSTSDADE